MRIAAVGVALPPHYYEQGTIISHLESVWGRQSEVSEKMASLSQKLQVQGRHLARPLEDYAGLRSFGACNDAWIDSALDLSEQALDRALVKAGLRTRDVDAIFFASVTGIASPSIDARLVNRMGLRPDVKRVPIFGLGCVAGAATISRAADYVLAFPDQVAAVVCVELCSLTLQRDDVSVANLISSGLFGDGASAAVVVGSLRSEGDGPTVRATRSVFYPDTEDVMGWQISQSGFRIVLSPSVPSLALERIAGDVDAFLTDRGVDRTQIRSWVCHPGGPKVLLAMQKALGLENGELELSWESLRRVGNLSSASVLAILGETMDKQPPAPGSLGMLLAMGPGFCSELVLLSW